MVKIIGPVFYCTRGGVTKYLRIGIVAVDGNNGFAQTLCKKLYAVLIENPTRKQYNCYRKVPISSGKAVDVHAIYQRAV